MNFPNKMVSDEKLANLMRRAKEFKITASLSLQTSQLSSVNMMDWSL